MGKSKKDLSKILFVDVEATCWNAQPPGGEQNEIIEIGCSLFDLTQRKIIKQQGILVKPQFSQVSPFCTELTTLTQELLDKEGVLYQEALEILDAEFSPKLVTWASWGDYDRKQFEKNGALYGTKYPFGSTHLNVKNLFALKHRLPKEMAMTEALEHIKMKLVGTHHRGIDDSGNIARLGDTLI